MRLLKAFFAVFVVLFTVQQSNADFLNDYFSDKVFGPRPGPCPSTDRRCHATIDPNRLNPATANIVICLLQNYCFVETFFGCLHPRVTVCAKIKDWFKSGEVAMWDLQCKNFGLGGLNWATTSKSNTEVQTVASGNQIQMNCQGMMRLDKLLMEYGVLGIRITGDVAFTSATSPVSFFNIKMTFQSPNFQTSVPNNVIIPPDQCSVNVGTDIYFDLANNKWEQALVCINLLNIGCAFSISFLPLESVTNLIVNGIEAAMGSILCDILSQGAKTDPAHPATSPDGELNIKLDQFGNFINRISQGKPDSVLEFDAHPRDHFYYLTQQQLNDAVDFSDDNVLELMSVALNSWLAKEENGRLIINDAIDQLLGNTNGEFSIDLVAEDIILDGIVAANVADVFMKLEDIKFKGLNNVRSFALLENNYEKGANVNDRLHYTLNHTLEMSHVEFIATIRVRFQRGRWVTRSQCGNIVPCKPPGPDGRPNEGHPDTCACTTDREEFVFDFGMKWDNFRLDASTLSVFDPSQISEVRLGQLFGRDFREDPQEAVKNVVRCLAPGMYAAYFPSLAMSIGNINSPPTSIIPASVGLASLVQNTITTIDNMFNSVFRNAAPGITQGEARPRINTFLENDVVLPADLSKCMPYVPGQIPPSELYFNFEEGFFANIYPLINNVLGEFTIDTPTDINDVVQIMFEYFSETYADFPLETIDGQIGNWRTKPEDRTIMFIPGFENQEGVPGAEKFLNVSNFEMVNLDSFYALHAQYYGTTQNGIQMDLAFGHQLPANVDSPLFLSFQFRSKVDDAETEHGSGIILPIDETVKVTLKLDEIFTSFAVDHILVNRDLVYQLKMGQIDQTPCLFSVIDPGFAPAFSSVTAETVFLNVLTRHPAGQTAGLHPFARSLVNLQDATASGASSKFKAMVNTILNNGFANFLGKIENFDTSYTPNNCESAGDPLGSIFSIFTGFELPDTASVVEECIQVPEHIPTTPQESEAEVKGIFPNTTYFDFTDSVIVDALQSQFGTNLDDNARTGVLRDIAFLLANRSGTPLADAFYIDYLENKDGVLQRAVSFNLQTAESNFFFDLFDLEPLIYDNDVIIPGLYAEITNLTIRGIDRFAANTKLFQAKSKFTTGYEFAFDRDNELIVELNGYFVTDESFIGGTPGRQVREDFNIHTVVEGFQMEFEVLAAINTGIFGDRSLGHFFQVTPGDLDFIFADSMMECLFSIFFEDGISIPRMNMSFTNLIGPQLRTTGNFFSREVEDVMDQSLKLMTQFYIDAVPNIAYNCLRGSINDNFRNKWLAGQHGSCPEHPSNLPLNSDDQIFRFGTSKGLQRVQHFISSNFKADDYDLWNDIMKTLTTGADNKPSLLFHDDPVGPEDMKLVYKGVGYGELTAIVQDMKIINLQTFRSLQFIEPVDFDNYTTVTGFAIEGPTTFDFNFKVIAKDVFEDFDVLENDLTMKLRFADIDFALEIDLKLNVTEALSIRFSSISSLNELPCLLVPVQELLVTDFNLTVSDTHVEIGCFDKCQFPMFSSLEDGLTLNSDEDERLSQIVNDGIQFLVDYIEGSGAQRLLAAQIATADETCAEILGLLTGILDVEGSEDLDAAIFLGYVFLGFVVAGSMGVLALFPMHKQRRQKKLKEFSASRKTMEHDKEYTLFKSRLKSLFQHSAVPLPAKVIIPVVCILHVFLLIVAIIFSGAMNIILVFDMFGAQTNQIVLVPFTIVSTINDMWNSGSEYLAIIVAVASCAWPIVKNSLLMVIWFLPTTILGHRKRESVLWYLDLLGKWSFLDVFIVVMTLAALRTYLRLSAYARIDFLAEDTFNVDVNVTPERGIILLCVVASSSLVINHVISWYHDKVEREDQALEDELRGVLKTQPKRAVQRKPVSSHLFAGFDKAGRRRRVSKKSVRILYIANALSGLINVIGIFLPLVTFEMGGLIGILIAQIDRPLATKTYSIFDLALLVNQAPKKDAGDIFAVTFFQILLLANSTIFPIIQIASNFFIMATPLSYKSQRFALWFAYVASFWSAIECFLVAVVLTLLEVDRITVYIVDFISDDFCSNVQSILETLLGPQDGNCLKVEGFLETTAVAVFVGVFGQLVVTLFTLQLAESVLEDRYFQAYNGVRKNVKPAKMSWIRKQVMRLMTQKVRMAANQRRDDDAGSVTSGFDLLDAKSSVAGPDSPRARPPPQGNDDEEEVRSFAMSNPLFSSPDAESHVSPAPTRQSAQRPGSVMSGMRSAAPSVKAGENHLANFYAQREGGPVEDVDV